MTELSFAKQFLTALDSRPQKLSSDHVVDPKTYAAQPAFILPRMPNPKKRRTAADSTPGSTPSQPTTTISVTIKPTRGAYAPLTLPTATLTTSIHDLKQQYAAHASLNVEKIKMLHAKKPVSDMKTLKDVLGDAASIPGQNIELSVMVLGGATGTSSPAVSTPDRVASPPVAVPAPTVDGQPTVETSAPVGAGDVTMEEATPIARASTGSEVLKSDEFWEDLKGFLVQRVRDESEAGKLTGLFRDAWK
ncbi:hypothetical protein K490DRAFT_6285, partial [Saccharata proteae CBS 121410]